MGNILNFERRKPQQPSTGALADLLQGFSLEVMPKTAAKIDSFRAIQPAKTRVYIAHLDGTTAEEMRVTARRIVSEGFPVMPHIPARIVADKAMLADWLQAYADIGVSEALLIAGGVDTPKGDFHSSMQLLETGLFDKFGFQRLHVGGHPEGNKDIDPDGSDRAVTEALHWKNAFADRTDAKMAIATQFCFEAEPVIAWANRLMEEGIHLPIHIGVAGPAKLQTLIRFAMLCGVGPSIRVLTRRAADLTKLMLPFTPEEFLTEIAEHKAAHPDFNIEAVHFFPLGGIPKTAEFCDLFGGASGSARATAL
jgi:methylenetetrahydrofolate reductase (NADPH)